MKTGRNEPCPCGSGIKYKNCCLNKTSEEQLAEAIKYSIKSINKNTRIKQCLHPNQEECDQKIVRAHAIQNNRILNRVAEDGLVITMDGISNLIFQGTQTKGRKIATTFTGFCKYHDKVLFQNIEDKDFIGSEEQVFLLTYRTMAWHYHKKQERINANSVQYEKMFERGYDLARSEEFRLHCTGLNLGAEDNKKEKKIFDKLLLDDVYDEVNFCIWEIPYEVKFAISMMHELEYDISGHRINDLKVGKNVKSIYLNIFPVKSKSFCVWSWLTKNNPDYNEFSKQFMELEVAYRENYLNNYLPIWSDAIIMSPRLWRTWGSQTREALIVHANFDFLHRIYEDESSDHKFTYMDTPWNLFEKL